MNTTPDTIAEAAEEAATVSLVKAEATPASEPAARTASDILGQLLDEHPDWRQLLDDIDAGAVAEYQLPSFLDDEPSLRVQFGHEMAAHVAGYQSDDRMLTNWQRDAWVRCNDAITVSDAPAALR